MIGKREGPVQFGDPAAFAIDTEITHPRIFQGRFRYWIGGVSVGDWDDTVMLNSCRLWMRDFCATKDERIRPDLFELPAADLFREVVDVFYTDLSAQEVGSHLRHYFHLEHIGMSSTDNSYRMMLIGDGIGSRLIWKDLKIELSELNEKKLPFGYFEEVGQQFCQWVEPLWEQFRSA